MKDEKILKDASFIGVCENVNTFVLTKEFELSAKQTKVVINASALGLYFIKINGKRLDDRYLAPGWTSYNKMLQYQTYDATNYLQKGINKIEMVVNVGWYSGRLAWENNYNVYGKVHAGIMELIFDNQIISTDLSWKAYTSNIVSSSIYDGEVIDFNNEIKELKPIIVNYNKSLLVKQINEPVRDTAVLEVKEVIKTPSNDIVYDFGQNMAGVVKVNVPADCYDDITLKFAEILIDGEFYTENLRSAKATDVIKNANGKEVNFEFTFHGFRYLHVESKYKFDKSAFKAIVRHTDMERTGYIHSSDYSFNKLMENITWGERSNFVDIPTDCPQRDERLGWTGDINVFARTAAYNYDVRKIIEKFLCDLRNDQLESGEIPHVAPNCLYNGSEPSAIWTDVICMLPYTMYEMYGDKSFLSNNIDAMKKYVACLEKRMEDGLIVRGQVYGDWLALDNEVVFSEEAIGRTNKHYLGNVFYLEDVRIISIASKILGNEKDYFEYKAKYNYTLKRVREEYFSKSGKFLMDTLTSELLALRFNIVEKKNRKALEDAFALNIKRHKFHVTTGFIGTAYILFVLADINHFDYANKLMMNHEYPGWLYEVDMGATTTWERWSSLMPNGKPDSKGMNSYNHYAYGAMKEFVYRKVLGIEASLPGFKKVRIEPHVVDGLNDIEGAYNSVNGLIKSAYKIVNDEVIYNISIPKTIKGDIYIEGKCLAKNTNGEFEFKLKRNTK